nr:hypothetical protein [Priestia megaterium]WEZ59265.1 hypothetical protein P5632_03930 [Priestia megaterium]
MTRKTLVMTAAVLVGLSAAWIGNEKIAYAQSASTTKLSDLEKKSDDVNQNINQNKEKLKEVQEKKKTKKLRSRAWIQKSDKRMQISAAVNLK